MANGNSTIIAEAINSAKGDSRRNWIVAFALLFFAVVPSIVIVGYISLDSLISASSSRYVDEDLSQSKSIVDENVANVIATDIVWMSIKEIAIRGALLTLFFVIITYFVSFFRAHVRLATFYGHRAYLLSLTPAEEFAKLQTDEELMSPPKVTFTV